MNTNNDWIDEFIEKGGALEHDRWAKWQKWMHEHVYDSSESINPHLKVIPTELFNRWERQIATNYKDLSEKEKESDRIEVRKYLPLIKDLLTKKDQEHKAELEMIKGEIESKSDNFCGKDSKKIIRTEDAISILDSHINKLSTE